MIIKELLFIIIILVILNILYKSFSANIILIVATVLVLFFTLSFIEKSIAMPIFRQNSKSDSISAIEVQSNSDENLDEFKDSIATHVSSSVGRGRGIAGSGLGVGRGQGSAPFVPPVSDYSVPHQQPQQTIDNGKYYFIPFEQWYSIYYMLLFKDASNKNFLTTNNKYYTSETDFFRKNHFITKQSVREVKNITQSNRDSQEDQLIVDNEIIVYNDNKYTYIKLIVQKYNVTPQSIINYVLSDIIPRLNAELDDISNLSAEIPPRQRPTEIPPRQISAEIPPS